MIFPDGGNDLEISDLDCYANGKVNFLFSLKDHALRAQYQQFCYDNQNFFSTILLLLSILFYTFPSLSALSFHFKDCDSAHKLVHWAISLLFIIVINASAWRVVLSVKSASEGTKLALASKQCLYTYHRTIYLVLNVFLSYRMIYRVVNGPCIHENDFSHLPDNWDCNPGAGARMLPPESTLLIMLQPILLFVTSRGAHYEASLFILDPNLAVLVFCAVYCQAYGSIVSICFYTFSSFVILIEMRRSSLSWFLSISQRKGTPLQSAKLCDDDMHFDQKISRSDADEMRALIANVTHDLKTPLTSFLAGVECIKDTLREVEALAAVHPSTRLVECIQSIDMCIHNMMHTNSFMTMTINRCIDYTKVCKGVQLLPKHETIDLHETLSMPIQCMQDVQQRIGIHLEPIPVDICSHLITDKQWLQENLLCLLSNAIKYSHDGEINIRVQCRHPTTSFSIKTADYLPWNEVLPLVNEDTKRNLFTLPSLTPSIASFLRFEVEDQGIGLSDDAMAALFSPFKQAQRLAGGTGLGLYSLAKRTEALGGQVGVHHRRDQKQGSIFWFEIPYRPDHQASMYASSTACNLTFSVEKACSVVYSVDPCPSPIGSEHSHSPSCTMDGPSVPASPSSVARLQSWYETSEDHCTHSPLDILVVDDSPAILKMTAMLLKRHKHNVWSATNGAEAVNMVTERMASLGRGFDVVLMDLQMPVMDGLEATRRLRVLEQTLPQQVAQAVSADLESTVPPQQFTIIGMSANNDDVTTDEAYRVGVSAFIAKPFSLDTFYQVCKEAQHSRVILS